MRPFTEAPDELLAAVRGVVFDVDDTVTRDGMLEAIAFDAMWRLHRAGLALVAVTGRPFGWAELMARHWPIDAAVFENGAGFVARRGAAVVERFVEDEAARTEQSAVLDRVRRRVAEELPGVRVAGDQRARRADLAFDVGETDALDRETVARLVALIEAEGARCLVSSVHAHVIPGDWDKARGAELAVRQMLGIDLARERPKFAFVGDSGNDAVAFAWFPLSVGVANVRGHLASLPVSPAYVTDEDRGRGFAEVAERILASRSSARR